MNIEQIRAQLETVRALDTFNQRTARTLQADFVECVTALLSEISRLTAELAAEREKTAAYREAEAEGRLVVLPCKVGDTVHVVGGHIVECRVEFFSVDGKLTAAVSFECDDDCEGCPFSAWSFCEDWSCSGAYGSGMIEADDFGKTVFLTRAEAEAALQEGKNDERDG